MLKIKHLIQWGNGFNMRTLQRRPSARSCLISFIFLFVTIFKIMNSQECKSVNGIPGYRLVNHVLETVNLVSFVRCTVLCTDHPDCYSINHFTTANTCELNNKTKFWSLGDFLRSDNTFYMDMLVRHYDPCVVEKPCQSNGRCIPYHNNGTFRCECSKRYTGKTCDQPRKDRNVNCSGHILDLCQLQMTAWKATILGPSSVNLSGCNPDDVQNTTELLLFVSHSRTDALEDYGKYQIVRINDNVGCTVTLLTPIKLALSGTPCEVIAQRLPYFDQVSLTKSCQVTCGGAIGSILALRAVKLTIDSTSKIEVNGKGYRGGAGGNSSGGGGYGGETFVCLSPTYGKGGDRGQSGDAGGGAGEVSTVGPGGFNAGGGGGDSTTNEDDGAGGGGGGGHYSGGGGGGGATGCLSQNSGNGGNASSVINAYAGGGGSSNCPGKNGSNGGTSGGNAGNSVRGGKGGSSPSSVYGGGGGGGGLQYGNADFQTRLSYGGGGGGGGGSEFGFAGGRGGNGGGLVLLLLDQLTLNGTIEAKGSLGKCSPVNTNYRGAAGGSGAGGSVVIFTKELFGVPNGKIFVQGGTPPFCAFYTSGGGGGGIGRWVVKTSSTLYTSG